MKYNEERDEMQMNEITESLNRKDYLLTVCQAGDESMSHGDTEKQVLPKRSYAVCSLMDIPEYIELMKTGFWEHPDLNNPKVENRDIPYDEKKWGRCYDLTIEPFSEELEKEYLQKSKNGFFKMKRKTSKRRENRIHQKGIYGIFSMEVK